MYGSRSILSSASRTESMEKCTVRYDSVRIAHSEHIDTRFHYIRSIYASSPQQVDLKHVTHSEQAADILTKPLGINKHADAIKLLQLTQFPFETASSRI